ncbi:MAG: type IV secretory system conjugative DNA transfer family protein, partial [Alphaproteobacteria bacterium]
GCLTGLTGYLCGKVDQARANDYFVSRLNADGLDEEDYIVLLSYYKSMRDFPEVKEAIRNAENRNITVDNYLPIGKWGIIPKKWRGQDASFAMLLDILNNNQMRFTAELARRRKEHDVSGMMTDPWKMILEDIVLETAYYGYGRRTLLELTQVESLPEKQRGSVISMALSGVNIFKNAAVRTRTSLNDFDYTQLRGIKDKVTGVYKPVTIYLSVPLEDIGSSMLVSSLFINMAVAHLMEFGPNEGENGPYPMMFMLDDFQHMPSLKSIADGIVFGRSKENSFFISVQDWHQINSRYDRETTDIIISSVAAKIIKRQNNPETRNILIKGMESLTKVVHSYSRNICKIDFRGSSLIGMKEMGWGYDFWRGVSHKIKTQSDSVLGGSGFLSMANTKQIVLYAGRLHRPIVGQTPLYFKNNEYKALASLLPAPPIPAEFVKDTDTLEIVSQIQMDEE